MGALGDAAAACGEGRDGADSTSREEGVVEEWKGVLAEVA